MKETVQEYVLRIQGKLAGQDPLKVQSTTAKKLARLIKGVPPARLRKRPAPEKWSPAEIIAHLVDAEIVVSWRVRSILGAPDSTASATRANPSSSSASSVNRIWLSTKCSHPSSGSIAACMPSVARNPSNASHR